MTNTSRTGGGGTPAAPPGYMTPAPTYGGSPAAGSKPFVPNLKGSANQAIRGNISLLPNLRNLSGQVNQFNLNQLYNQLNKAIPGLSGLQANAAANIGSALAGELPPDVLNQILTNAAEFGVASGTGGGGRDVADIAPGSLAGHAGLRSLGLSSLDQTRWGAGALTSALAGAPRVDLLNPASFFITPEQQQEANWLNSLISAAPDPEAAFQRALSLNSAGMNRGFNSIPPAAPGAPGGAGAPSSTTSMLADLLNRYLAGNAGGSNTGGNIPFGSLGRNSTSPLNTSAPPLDTGLPDLDELLGA